MDEKTPPPPEPVLRFISYHPHGFRMGRITLILGHGWKKHSGHPHAQLLEFYPLIEKRTGISGTYAGYLTIRNGTVSVYEGGSETLKIENDEEINKILNERLAVIDTQAALMSLFPLINAKMIRHLLVHDV